MLESHEGTITTTSAFHMLACCTGDISMAISGSQQPITTGSPVMYRSCPAARSASTVQTTLHSPVKVVDDSPEKQL